MSVRVSVRMWWINKPLINRELEICQNELQSLGGKDRYKSMEAWNYRVYLGNCKLADWSIACVKESDRQEN